MKSPRLLARLALCGCGLTLLAMGCDKDSTAPDFVRPAAVTLAPVGVTNQSITMTWLAPGDDGVQGRATRYDIRFSSTTSLTPNWWDSIAVAVPTLPIPQEPGSAESLTVSGLEPETTYYLALKTADEVPNWSAISNVLIATTMEAAP